MTSHVPVSEEPDHVLPISVAIRPVRVVTLVPTIDAVAWERTFEVAVATHTGVWGGRSNLVLPHDPSTRSNDLFWALMRVYDPDVVVHQAWVVRDAAVLAPDWLRDRERDHRAWARANDVDPDDVVRDGMSTGLNFPGACLPGDDKQLCERIAARVGPLDLMADRSLPVVTSDSGAQWPATRPPTVGTTARTLVGSGPIRNDALRLLATVEYGRATKHTQTLAEEAGAEIIEQTYSPPILCHHIARQQARDDSVWALGHTGLADYTVPMQQTRSVLVVGSSPWDFALHYALRRMGVTSWYLSSRLRSTKWYLDALLDACRRDHGPGIAVVSTSSPRSASNAARELTTAKYGPGGSGPVEAVPWIDVIPETPTRTLEQGMEGWLEENLALRQGRTVRVPTPLSRTQERTGDRGISWMVDVASEEWAPIAHPDVAAVVAGPGGPATQTRAGRSGLSYYSHRMLRMGGQSAQAQLYRPHLYAKGLYEQILAALTARGWTCHLSEKGAFSEAVATLFGGSAALIDALHDERLRLLLKCYRAPRDKTRVQRPHDKKRPIGAFLTEGSRRVLTADEISQVIGGHSEDFVDNLVDRGALERGVVLKCERCRQASWYQLSVLDRIVPCKRCASGIKFLNAHGIDGGTVEWRYKLAEVVHHFAINNGVEPVVAVAGLVGPRPVGPIQVCHELLVTQPGTSKVFEVDLFVSFGTELWIGEANSTGTFADKAGRLIRLAEALNTQKLVFATSAAEISRDSLETINKSFRRPRYEVRMLTGVPGLK